MLKKILIVMLLISVGCAHKHFQIDFTQPEYTTNNNFVKIGNDNTGQCTWFVDGRVQEKLGFKLKFKRPYSRHAKHWMELLDYQKGLKPKPNSIAVYASEKYGHVVFVEDVTENYIYYREANFPPNHKIDKHDGILRKMSKNRFPNKGRGQVLIGYIYLEN